MTAKKFDYPLVKTLLWRFMRFIGDAIAASLTTDVILKAFSLSDIDQGIRYLLFVVAGAAFAAIAKYFRDKATSYESLAHKLPL